MLLTYKVEPWKHQKLAIRRASIRSEFGLFFEQGAGKTSTAVNIMRQKCFAQRAKLRTLILCPPIVIENWKREILAHSNFLPTDITCLVGTKKKRLHDFRAASGHVFITNYESVLMKEIMDAFIANPFSIVIYDESQKLKSVSSKRTKYCLQLSKLADFRFILSGTPITNSLEDIFSQYLVMDLGKTFGTKIGDFRDKYFDDLNKNMPRHCYFPMRVPKPNAMKAISNAIQDSSMRVLKEQCLDLPPLVRQRVDVEMGTRQALVYKDLEKEFVAQLDDGYVAADLAITQGLRLQQVVTGFVPNEKGENQCFLDNPRKMALNSIIEDLDPRHQFLVWAVFKQNYADIREVLQMQNISFGEIHGDTKNGQEIIDAFQSGKLRAILAHPRSAGIGANLTKAGYSIFYSRSFSLEDDMQAEARNHRAGSEIHEKVTRIDIVTPGTIDEYVLEALQKKMNVAEAVLNRMKHDQGN